VSGGGPALVGLHHPETQSESRIPSVPIRRRSLSLLAALSGVLLATAACSTDPQRVRDGDPAPPPAEAPRYESRTGVPVLMDIPVIGFLFCRTTIVR
jgi:hypothetical protein